MMKNRSFMLGLGCGLIAGALLLQLMISGGAAPLTKNQVLKGAAQLNLKVTDESGKLLTADKPAVDEGQTEAPEEQAGNSPATSAPSAPAAATTPSPADTPKSVADPAVPAEPSAPAKGEVLKPSATAAPAAPAKPKTPVSGAVSVRIPSGITLTETADLLAQSGAIADKDAFLKSAKDRKINTIIQYGTYSFKKGESINSIIDKLITVKK